MGDSHLKGHLNISVQAGDSIRRGRNEENKDMGGAAMDVLAVSVVVLIWIFNVSTLELASASQIPAVGQSASPVVMVKTGSCTSRNWNYWCL